MLSETIKRRLAERFAAPLSEFHKRRIVFWQDEEANADEVDELALPGGVLLNSPGQITSPSKTAGGG